MRQATLLFLFFIFLTPLFSQPEAPVGKQWVTVDKLSDEFNTWDNTKWFKSLWNYGVPVQMLDKNSGVSDGKLWIKATLAEGEERWFETSRVMSKTKIKFPMYTECSMRTAHISAYNTFWTNNGNASNRDEIDICEHNSKPSYSADARTRPWEMYSQYFIVVDEDTERAHNEPRPDTRDLSDTNPLKGLAWNEAFHTLGMWWKDKNTVQFYLNGEEVGTVTSTRDFTLSQSIIWDLWTIDATWSGGLAVQSDLLVDSINTMYVDWIHTYTLEDVTAVDENNQGENVKLIYSPRQIVFRIDVAGAATDSYYSLFDTHGRMVKSAGLQQGINNVSVSELKTGIYFLKTTHQNKIITKSIMVQ